MMTVVVVISGAVIVVEVIPAVVVVRALVCAGAVSDMFVKKVLTVVDMRADVLIIVSDVAVGLFMGALNDVILGVLSSIDVNVLVDVFAGVITLFDFDMSAPLEEFRC